MRNVTAGDEGSSSIRMTLPITSIPGPGANIASPTATAADRAAVACIAPAPAPRMVSERLFLPTQPLVTKFGEEKSGS